MAGLPEQLPLGALTARCTHRRALDELFVLVCRVALSELRHGQRGLLLPQRRTAPGTQGRIVPALMPRKVLVRREGTLLLLQLLLGLLASEEAVDQLEESHGHSNLHAVNRTQAAAQARAGRLPRSLGPCEAARDPRFRAVNKLSTYFKLRSVFTRIPVGSQSDFIQIPFGSCPNAAGEDSA